MENGIEQKRKFVTKTIIILSIAGVVAIALACIWLQIDKSKLIKKAFEIYGYNVTEETVENETVQAYLRDFSDEQLQRVSEYKFLKVQWTILDSVIMVCPSAADAKKLLNMNDENLYREMKDNGAVAGNCIFFGVAFPHEEIFGDYVFALISAPFVRAYNYLLNM